MSGASGVSGVTGGSAAPNGPGGKAPRPVVPGELLLGADPVPLNPGRPVTVLRVLNTGDRPVQVGSHLHFPAANDALDFDRAAAWGRRLDVPAGTAVRFEPGIAREVALVPLAGARVVRGLKAGRGGVLGGAGDAGAGRTAAAGSPRATDAADPSPNGRSPQPTSTPEVET
ncbi:urease subunit beta [Yinghuangia sp. YIM S09857]|uniref:urease subunit beta n=1 Tax=Yinghuangia sp. YIM S09857 TaxID=3436929 RepID=UPI003F538592